MPTIEIKQLKLTQTPLGQGEVQTLYFTEATGTGEIEIAGLKIKLEKGDSSAVVAQKVQQALAKAYGFSELGGSLRQYTVNADGSLTVRAAVSAGNVRDLQMVSAGTTGVSFRTETVDYLPSGDTFESEVRLGLGRTGTSLDLAKLGFRTGVYLSGQVKEDLLVFATGEDQGLGYTLGATYTEGSRDPIDSLRAEPFDVVFTSPTQYRIVDRNSGSIVADRRYDPTEGIRYRGLLLTLNAPPAAGDRFAIDGNQDGIGNNANTLRLIQLENAAIVGGPEGRTLTDAYGQAVSDVGNMAFQASIAQKALEVVKDQAVQARDKVSGVSLDEEAADLIRFQQAYQANAKVMQTASILFDAIINIR
jgi:flagellar hook-associated protein FlgK